MAVYRKEHPRAFHLNILRVYLCVCYLFKTRSVMKKITFRWPYLHLNTLAYVACVLC